ncbi:hypothetical protein ACJX0J_015582, partial [Zea mays]
IYEVTKNPSIMLARLGQLEEDEEFTLHALAVFADLYALAGHKYEERMADVPKLYLFLWYLMSWQYLPAHIICILAVVPQIYMVTGRNDPFLLAAWTAEISAVKSIL